jgi:hypothetical protein
MFDFACLFLFGLDYLAFLKARTPFQWSGALASPDLYAFQSPGCPARPHGPGSLHGGLFGHPLSLLGDLGSLQWAQPGVAGG